uniref:Uncharacterized protein n=1 Tax=Acrobeloides nanus TaxID=290746 RepID=A0A914C739_9BILA
MLPLGTPRILDPLGMPRDKVPLGSSPRVVTSEISEEEPQIDMVTTDVGPDNREGLTSKHMKIAGSLTFYFSNISKTLDELKNYAKMVEVYGFPYEQTFSYLQTVESLCSIWASWPTIRKMYLQSLPFPILILDPFVKRKEIEGEGIEILFEKFEVTTAEVMKSFKQTCPEKTVEHKNIQAKRRRRQKKKNSKEMLIDILAEMIHPEYPHKASIEIVIPNMQDSPKVSMKVNENSRDNTSNDLKAEKLKLKSIKSFKLKNLWKLNKK